MKKYKYQFMTESAGDLKASSTALTLQQFKKEAEKKEAAAESAKVRCRICFKETAPTPRCFGHGGGSGGGGSGADTTSEDKASLSDEQSLLKAFEPVDDAEELMGEFGVIERSEGLDAQSDEDIFAPDLIADLVARGLLVINNDRESMTLAIHLECEPKSLSAEQRDALQKFMAAIINEFTVFKEQHQLPDDCINTIEDEEGVVIALRINLPTRSLYDAFIQQLANNLLPTANPKLQTQAECLKTNNFASSPLSMEPRLINKRKDMMHDEAKQNEAIANENAEEQEPAIFNPSPFTNRPY